MKIYVAGPLSDKNRSRDPSRVVVDYISNLHKMCDVAVRLLRMGHSPYVPGLDFLIGLVAGDMTEREYRQLNLDFIPVCDAIFVVASNPSVEEEVRLAENLGLRVFRSLDEVPIDQR